MELIRSLSERCSLGMSTAVTRHENSIVNGSEKAAGHGHGREARRTGLLRAHGRGQQNQGDRFLNETIKWISLQKPVPLILVLFSLIRTSDLRSKVLTLDNKNKKTVFCFVLFSLIRTSDLRSKVLSLEKAQIKFGFLLAYSYL